MKKLLIVTAIACMPIMALAQGWPANYGGVMLQGFSWNNYTDPRWSTLEKNAPEWSQFFDLIWVPQSGQCGKNDPGTSMGYNPLYYFKQNSTFGTEAELRSMIQTYKSLGTGIIADVVINHRSNWNSWVDFPSETYKGVTYQMKSTDICKDDDGGETAKHTGGLSLSENNDTGEDWSGMRDLDHKSANVQTCVKAYEDYLLNDLGYTGFRYDMTKGFGAQYVAEYNAACNVQYSVGEYWDGNTTALSNWIANCSVNGVKQSATFDFAFRYAVRDVVRGRRDNGTTVNWSSLGVAGIAAGSNKRYAVTFVENHDMQDRGNVTNYTADPITKDTLAANAYLLAMPGTPCVFLPHWKDYMKEIKQMIDVRKLVGITNQSTARKITGTSGNFSAFLINGEGDNKLLAVVGPDAKTYNASSLSTFSGTEILSGYHYRYFVSDNMVFANPDMPSGSYRDAIEVTLTAINAPAGTMIAYTLDGSNPTASSSKLASGGKLTVSADCVLKCAVSTNLSTVTTRNYTIIDTSQEKDITIYVNLDSVADTWTSGVNYHTWGGDGTHGTTWPGAKAEGTKLIDGRTWYYRNYILHGGDDLINIVLSTGTGSPQTVDINNVTDTKYYEVSKTKSGTKHTVKDVTGSMQSAPIPGDLNGDGNVNTGDVSTLYAAILSGSSDPRFDINGDGNVNTGDVSTLYAIILGS